jgi:hypothetical protein
MRQRLGNYQNRLLALIKKPLDAAPSCTISRYLFHYLGNFPSTTKPVARFSIRSSIIFEQFKQRSMPHAENSDRLLHGLTLYRPGRWLGRESPGEF